MKITLSIELRITVIISEIVPFPIPWKKLHDITPKHTLRIVIIIKRRALLTSTERLISLMQKVLQFVEQRRMKVL